MNRVCVTLRRIDVERIAIIEQYLSAAGYTSGSRSRSAAIRFGIEAGFRHVAAQLGEQPDDASTNNPPAQGRPEE